MIPKPDLTRLKPYGDTMDDGRIQLSFTLPVPDDERAVEAARAILTAMGLSNPLISWHEALDDRFTRIIAYATFEKGIDYTRIEAASIEAPVMTMEETDPVYPRSSGPQDPGDRRQHGNRCPYGWD